MSREGILVEFFLRQRLEVIAMCIFTYDREEHMQQVTDGDFDEKSS